MNTPAVRRRCLSHAASFAAGVVIATAVGAHAVPGDRSRARADRYQTLDAFAQSLSYIAAHHVDPVDERSLIYGAIRGMVRTLDRHSKFYSPRKYRRLRQDTEGEFGGVGIRLARAGENARPTVDDVIPGSPAARAGVRVGDRVLAIDGESTDGGGDVRSWHTALRGLSGTSVTVRIARPTWSAPRDVLLVRARVVVPSVAWTAIEPGIGYVAIAKFQEATAADVTAALTALRASEGGLRALVLDLRGNPGGLLDQAIRVADLFLDRGLIVTVRGRSGAAIERERAHAPGTFDGFRMVVLVDRDSASAAEIVVAALQDHRRATVLGAPTYGKGSIQTFLDLKDGSGLKLTTARFYSPSGRMLEGNGITPDIHVPPSESGTGDDAAPDRSGSGGPRSRDAAAALRRRLRADRQFRRAHQTVRAWLESK